MKLLRHDYMTIPGPVNQSINVFNVLGGNWDPTDRKEVQFSEFIQIRFVSYMQSIPKETTTCIWFTQSHEVCNGTTVLQEVNML